MPGVKQKPAVKFDVSCGKIIAIDFNCWFHGLCSKPQNALCIACHPPYPPTDLLNTLSSWHEHLLQHKITPYHTFDGSKHPMKANANKHRSNKRVEALKSLRSFYDRGKDVTIELDEAEHAEALKNIKTHLFQMCNCLV